MDYKAKAIELLGEKKEIKKMLVRTGEEGKITDLGDSLFDKGINQMHSKAVEVVEGLLEKIEVLETKLLPLGSYISDTDKNGGIDD